MHFVAVLILLIIWIILFPMQALDRVIELKRYLRNRIIQKAGYRGAQELAEELYSWANLKGIDSEIVDEVLNNNWQDMCYKLGSAAANDKIGEPTVSEK